MKSRKGRNNPMFGKQHSQLTRLRQSLVRKGKFAKERNPNYKNRYPLESRMNISWSRHGTVGVNKDGIRKYVKKEVLHYYIQRGWQRGFRIHA